MQKNLIAAVVGVIFTITLLPICSFADGAVGLLEKAERPIWNVGDIRTYQISRPDEKSFTLTETVTAVSKEEYTVTIERAGKKTIELYSLDLMLEKTMDSSGKIIEKYDTGIAKIKWPLKAGGSWSAMHIVFNKSSGRSLVMTIDIAVTAETLVMNSKKISTLKMIAKRRVGQQQTYIDKLERWYDPAASCFIKSALTRLIGDVGEKNYVKELVSFTPGPGK